MGLRHVSNDQSSQFSVIKSLGSLYHLSHKSVTQGAWEEWLGHHLRGKVWEVHAARRRAMGRPCSCWGQLLLWGPLSGVWELRGAFAILAQCPWSHGSLSANISEQVLLICQSHSLSVRAILAVRHWLLINTWHRNSHWPLWLHLVSL